MAQIAHQEFNDSTAIKSAGYDAAEKVLEIRFKNGGVYRYFDVPLETSLAFHAAKSKGRFFRECITNKFQSVKGERMKRYLLFANGHYYPAGGWLDFRDSFDSKEAAEKQGKVWERQNDWWHVLDSESGQIVAGNNLRAD